MDLPENILRDHAKEKEKISPNKATSPEVITSAQPCIIDSPNTLVKLRDESQVKIWLKDIIPPYRQPGGAISAGDCFFHSIADSLNQKSGKEEYTIQSLRIFCDEYVKDPKNSWVIAENIKDREDHNNYLVRIRFTAEELLAKEKAGQKLGLATWGRPKIEGRIFCEQYNVRIHVIQIQEDGATHRYLIDRNGETDDYNPDINYQDLNILHIVNYHNHFVPLFNCNLFIPKAQRALLVGSNTSIDNLSIKSDNKKPIKGTSIATVDMNAEHVSIRRVTAGIYSISADALNSIYPSLVQHASLVPALPSINPLLTTATTDIKNLSSEEVIANVVIDEKPTASKVISQHNVKPTILQQHIQVNAAMAVLIPPKTEAKVAALTTHLKNYYQKYDNKITRIFGQPLDLADYFVNLAIVKNEEQKQSEKDLLKIHQERTQIYSSYEDIYSTREKEVIFPQDIFNERDNHIPKRLAIIGRAGIGKSTLAQYLSAYEWAVKNRWQDKYDVVVKIKLRNLTKEHYGKNPSLGDIIMIECTDSTGTTTTLDKASIEATLKSITEKTLVILDGWDEYNMKESPCVKTISDLMKSTTLSIIVLSRPYTNLNPKEFDLILECIGFATENIPQYINKICEDKAQAPLILSFLRNNPPIHSLAHIPIILDMICEVWDEEMRTSIEPMTMTALYNKMVVKLWKVYMEKQEEQNPGIHEDKLLEKKEKAKEFLCLLAFNAMENNTIMLSYQLIENTIKTIYKCSDEDVERKLKDILAAGFLNTSNNKFLRGDYYFPHLTFQEFFAAKYLVTSGIDTILSHLNQHASDSRYEFMYVLVAGLLKFEKNVGHILSERYFQFFLNKINSGIDACIREDRQILFVFMRSLEENKIDLKEIPRKCWLFIYVLIVRPLNYNATLLDRKLLLSYLKNSPFFCKQLNIIAELNRALPYAEKSYITQAIDVLNDVGFVLEKIENCKEEEIIHNLLESLSFLVNRANANTVSNNLIGILKKPILFNIYSNPEIFKNIVLFLKSLITLDSEILEKYKSEINPTQFHNLFILKVLEYYKQSVAKEVYIKTYIANLSHPNSSFRQLAAGSLIELNYLTEELFKVLIQNLNDSNSVIRLGAFNALKKLDKIDDSIVAIFVRNLSSDDYNPFRDTIRDSALAALEELGKSNDPIVIEAHLKNLNNINKSIKLFTIRAITKLGHLDDNMVTILFDSFSDKEYEVRIESLKCLANFIKTNHKVFNGFINKLKNDYQSELTEKIIETLDSLDKTNDDVLNVLINFVDMADSQSKDMYSFKYDYQVVISAINVLIKYEKQDEKIIKLITKKIYFPEPPKRTKNGFDIDPEDYYNDLPKFDKVLSGIQNILCFLERSKKNEDYVIIFLLTIIKTARKYYDDNKYVNDKKILEKFICTAAAVLSDLYNLSPDKLIQFKDDVAAVNTELDSIIHPVVKFGLTARKIPSPQKPLSNNSDRDAQIPHLDRSTQIIKRS